jgi:hypothetical protein
MKISKFLWLVAVALLAQVESSTAQGINFATACTPTVATNPTCLAVADINGDGKPDLICASTINSFSNLGALTVLTNNGAGVFELNATIAVNGQLPAIVSADFNGDGKPDLACLSFNGNDSLLIFTNNGSGLVSNAVIFLGSANFPSTYSLATVDVNGDNKPDLVVAITGFSSSSLEIFTNNGTGKFSLNSTLTVNYSDGIFATDVNGDSKPDLVCAYFLDPSRFEILLNNGSGSYTSNSTFTAGYVNSRPDPTTLADINGDSRPDLIVFDSLHSAFSVLTNTGNGNFVIYSNAVNTIVANASAVAAADFNQDRKLDLVYSDPNGNTLVVLTNNGTGILGSSATVNVGRKPIFLATSDVNGDGKPDLISVNQTDNTLTVLTNATVIPVPPLNIVSISSQQGLVWPATPWNFVLQTTTNLATGNWSNVTTGTTNICITVSNLPPGAFFRLQMQ